MTNSTQIRHIPGGTILPRLHFFGLCLAFSLLLGAGPARGLEITPFATRDLGPLSHIYGLPATGGGRLLPPGAKELGVTADLISHNVRIARGSENLLLDGETYRFALGARADILDGLEVGIEVPLLVQGGGVTDSFIEGWHNFFGLPQGGRNTSPRNRLLFSYRENGAERLRVDDSAAGLGDILLTIGGRIGDPASDIPVDLALRGAVKLPTGSSSRLFGSGALDAALWLSASEDVQVSLGHVTGYGSIGALYLGRGDILPDKQRRFAGFGSFGLGWSPTASIAFKAQLNGHTAFYRNSDLRTLSTPSIQLVVGGTIGLTPATTLDIGVTEDISVNTAPDVTFHLSLSRKY